VIILVCIVKYLNMNATHFRAKVRHCRVAKFGMAMNTYPVPEATKERALITEAQYKGNVRSVSR